MIASMTGFARGEGACEICSWTWEVRSVNARGLEVRCRLPSGFEGLEPEVRKRVNGRLRRGSVFLMLHVTFSGGQQAVQINETVLNQILDLLPGVLDRLPGAAPPDAAAVLGLRGVIEAQDSLPSGDARDRLDADMLTSLDQTLDELKEGRQREGQRLAPVLGGHLDEIARLRGHAESLAAAQPEAIFNRLKEQVAALIELNPALTEERLVQESAILATKADLREELDRLNSHIAAARALMDKTGPVGRQLDFLCQEFNREANTLCSKSADTELTRTGIEMKSAIEQFREQVQNIE